MRQRYRGFDIDPGQHAISADVGVNNGVDTVIFKFHGQVDDIMAGQFRPTVYRHFAVFCIQADYDLARKSVAGLVQKARIFNRRRTDNDVADAIV